MAAHYLILKVAVEEELTLSGVGIKEVLYKYGRGGRIFEDIEVSLLILIAISVVVAQGVVGEIIFHRFKECRCYSIAGCLSHGGIYAVTISLWVGEGIAMHRNIYAVLLLGM